MKTMKKVLAFMLALAMVVTAVPVTNAEAATGLAKSKSYYAGKTYTLKLTTPSSWKSVSTKWSATNNNTKAVAISNKKAKSVTVKALKKGKAVVTAVVSYKKGGVATTKTYKCNVKVKAPTITASPKQVNLTVGETKQLTVKYVPASAVVSYKTSNADVATVTRDGLIKAVSAQDGGEAVVTAVLRCGKKVKESPVKVIVTAEAQADGIHASVTNAYDNANYPDVVITELLGKPYNGYALVPVYYGVGGKGVANETLVMTVKYDQSKTTTDTWYETTDANGYAYFKIHKLNDVDRVSYTVTLGTDASVKFEGSFQFGKISVQNLVSVNGVKNDWSFVYGGKDYTADGYKTLVPAENDARTAENYNVTGLCETHGYTTATITAPAGVDVGNDATITSAPCPYVVNPGTGEKCGKALKLCYTGICNGALHAGHTPIDATWDTGRGLSKVDGTWTNNAADKDTLTGLEKRYETIYVDSQQVSTTGKDDHKVGFIGGLPFITLPGVKSDLNAALPFQQDVNITEGAYGTNANPVQYVELQCDPNELTYATLNFENIALSKYTKLVITTWKDKASAQKPWDTSNRIGGEYVLQGPVEMTSRGYQIPIREKTYNSLCVRVEIQSVGQVNTDMAKGYTIKDITGVYKNKTASEYDRKEYIKGASIEWSKVTPVWSNEMPFNQATAKLRLAFDVKNVTVGQKDEATDKEIASVTYRVPVYPFTGNAVITTRDKNGSVIAYFAAPTKNSYRLNENVLDPFAAYCYRISEEEAFGVAGDFTQEGNLLTVNSDKAGVTTLAGKITGVPGLDATNDIIYTSVQWNPVENVIGHSGSIAFAGQDVEIVAQLVDKNGNTVSNAKEPITFSYTDKDGKPQTFALGSMTDSTDDQNLVSVMGMDASTDSKGQARLTLSAAKKNTVITDISASTKRYNVRIAINGTMVENLDMYWIEAEPGFVASNYDVAKTTAYTENVYDHASWAVNQTWEYGTDQDGNPICDASVGENWEYALGTYAADLPNYGVWKKFHVEVSDAKIGTSVQSGSKGTVTMVDEQKGVFRVTSTEVGKTKVYATVDGTPVDGKKVSFTVKNLGYAEVAKFENPGQGLTSFENEFKMHITWSSSGLKGSFVDVAGSTAIVGNDYTVYFKVTDSYGNPDTTTEVEVVNTTGGTITVEGATSGTAVYDSTVPVKVKGTAPNGLIAIKLSHLDKNGNVKADGTKETITVNVGGVIVRYNVVWKDGAALTIDEDTKSGAISSAATSKDPRRTYADNKSIVLTFNQDILAKSVLVDQFTVVRDIDGGKTMDIASVAVSGKSIILTFKNPVTDNVVADFKVSTKKATIDGVDYVITSTTGNKLVHLNNYVVKFPY